MNGKEIANILVQKLIAEGFIVHRYNSHTTSSIYIKLDYGLSCGIRIADHPGKKKYSYRFNVIKDYIGDKVIIKDGLICRFYDFTELEEVIKAVQKERQEKINKYFKKKDKKKSINMAYKITRNTWKENQKMIYIQDLRRWR